MHIHLLGPSGSGTSSLGKALADELNIPWFDSDDIFWEATNPPFTRKRSVERRQEILKEIDLGHDSWIISGSMLQWGDFLRDKLDLIIYLYVDKDTRIQRLITREKQRFGERILPGNDMYDNHRAFIEWAESYEDGDLGMRSKKSETAWIQEVKCKVIKIEKEIPIADEVMLVKKELGIPDIPSRQNEGKRNELKRDTPIPKGPNRAYVLPSALFSFLLIQVLLNSLIASVAIPAILIAFAIVTKRKSVRVIALTSVSLALYHLSMRAFEFYIPDEDILDKILKRFVSLSLFSGCFMIELTRDKKRPFYLGLGKANKRTAIIFAISCVITTLSFLPFMKFNATLFAYSLLFALINAPLEEIVWRGFILSKFSGMLGPLLSSVSTSIVFGLSHYMLGFSLLVCLLFAIGGALFTMITKKTKGLLFAVIIHFISNVCMGLTGILFG